MSQSNVFQIDNDIPWEVLGGGMQRKILGYDDKVMVVKVEFEAGAIGTLHSHHHSQASYVEAGVFDMTIGDEVKRLKKGDGFYVLPHVVHGTTCIEPGVLIDVFSPMREDFVGG